VCRNENVGWGYLSERSVGLKELEHRNVGRNILILKYDLDKSLSKKM